MDLLCLMYSQQSFPSDCSPALSFHEAAELIPIFSLPHELCALKCSWEWWIFLVSYSFIHNSRSLYFVHSH